jgi:hypothetical protein
MAWCRAKAKKANGERLMSAKPDTQIVARDVWAIMAAARGRCAYCGSLAVQKRPSTSTGQPLPWEDVEDRVPLGRARDLSLRLAAAFGAHWELPGLAGRVQCYFRELLGCEDRRSAVPARQVPAADRLVAARAQVG